MASRADRATAVRTRTGLSSIATRRPKGTPGTVRVRTRCPLKRMDLTFAGVSTRLVAYLAPGAHAQSSPRNGWARVSREAHPKPSASPCTAADTHQPGRPGSRLGDSET